MALPHAYNGFDDSAQLWSTDTHQWCLMWKTANPTGDATLRAGRRAHGTLEFTTYDLSAGQMTEFGGTVEDDDHNFPNLCVDDNDVAHGMANMHDHTLRYSKSGAGDITSWTAAAAVTNEQPRNTYPMFSGWTPNGLMFLCRSGPENVGGALGDNQSGMGNSIYWVLPHGSSTLGSPVDIFQGVGVPGAGPGGTAGTDFPTDDEYNWSAYTSPPFVEPDDFPHPGRLWLAGLWRAGVSGGSYPADVGRSNEMPFCIYTDDITDDTSWCAVDGSSVDLPLVPYMEGQIETAANPAAYLPWPRPDDWPTSGYLNRTGICVDPATGYPVIVQSYVPHFRFDWDGADWSRTQLGSPGYTLGGYQTGAGITPYFIDGELWYLSSRVVSSTSRRPALFKADGTKNVLMGGFVPTSSTPGYSSPAWGPQADPEAYRRWGRIEVLTPDGDIPRVFRYPSGAYGATA